MSSKKYNSHTFQNQSNKRAIQYALPTQTIPNNFTQSKHSRFSYNKTANRSIADIYPEELSKFYVFNYTFQDNSDETNTVFYDSNLKKYRTRSTIRNSARNPLSKSFNDSFNFNKKKTYVSADKNTFSYHKNKVMTLNQNNSLNSQKIKKGQNEPNRYNLTTLNKNYEKSSKERAEIIKQLKKEKDELLGINNYSFPKKQNLNKSENNIYKINIDKKINNNINNKNISKNISLNNNIQRNTSRKENQDLNKSKDSKMSRSFNQNYQNINNLKDSKVNSQSKDNNSKENKNKYAQYQRSQDKNVQENKNKYGQYQRSQDQKKPENKNKYDQYQRSQDKNLNEDKNKYYNKSQDKNMKEDKYAQYKRPQDKTVNEDKNKYVQYQRSSQDKNVKEDKNKYSQNKTSLEKNREKGQEIKKNQSIGKPNSSQLQKQPNIRTFNYKNNEKEKVEKIENKNYQNQNKNLNLNKRENEKGKRDDSKQLNAENEQIKMDNLIQTSHLPNEQDTQRTAKKSPQDNIPQEPGPISSSKKPENKSPAKNQSSNLKNINQQSKNKVQGYPRNIEDYSKRNLNDNFNNQKNNVQDKQKNIQNQEDILNIDDNKNNIKDERRGSNVSILLKNEEKTLVLIPGQSIEPKTVCETLTHPVEEVIQNPNGSTTSFIKQTKITTTTENVPINDNKGKSQEGAAELPMIKQYITYEYKTVTNINDKQEQQQQEENKDANISKLNNKKKPTSKFNKSDKKGNQDEYEDKELNQYKDGNINEDNYNLINGDHKFNTNKNVNSEQNEQNHNEEDEQNMADNENEGFENNQNNQKVIKGQEVGEDLDKNSKIQGDKKDGQANLKNEKSKN